MRNFQENPDIMIKKVCDISEKRLKVVNEKYPGIETTKTAEEIFSDKDIDLVAIVTPVFTHYELTKKALIKSKKI